MGTQPEKVRLDQHEGRSGAGDLKGDGRAVRRIFSRSYDAKTPISVLDPKHNGAVAYDVFADWLIKYNDDQR